MINTHAELHLPFLGGSLECFPRKTAPKLALLLCLHGLSLDTEGTIEKPPRVVLGCRPLIILSKSFRTWRQSEVFIVSSR